MDVRLPDGTVITNVPEGTTKAVLLAKVRGAERQQPQQQAQQPQEKKVSFGGGLSQSLLQGATFGFADEAQGLIAAAFASPFVSDKTFKELYTQARDSLREEQGQFSQQNPRTALAANVAGGIATGGGLFKGAQTAKQLATVGAGTGAVAGAGFSDSDELLSADTAVDALVGAGLGSVISVAAPKVINGLTSRIRKVVNRPELQIFDDTGKFTRDALDELDGLIKSGKASAQEVDDLISQNLAQEGVLTPEQAQRFNLFKSRGITPTRANVTQSTDDFRMQQEAVKRSGPVADVVSQQNEQLTSVVREGVENIGSVAQNLPEANSSVFSVVDDIVTKTDETVGQAYSVARRAAKGQPRVSLDNLAEAISNNRGQERVSGGVISTIRGVLKNKGLLKRGADFDIDKRGPRILGGDTKKLTVNEAEEIRQSLNSLFDSVTPQGRRLIRELKNALDDDVASAVGDDIFKDARAAKTAFQQMIERGKRNKFDKTKGGFLEDVIDNLVPEEKIIPKLLTGRDDDFIKFKNFLLQDAGDQGQAAWRDIKANVLRDALDKATQTMGKTEGGQPVFNVRLFRNSLNKLRNSKKFGELFNPDEIRLIDDIIEIGNARIPISGTQSGEGPSARAIRAGVSRLLQRIPVIGEGAQGLIDDIANARTDRRLLNVTLETEEALR